MCRLTGWSETDQRVNRVSAIVRVGVVFVVFGPPLGLIVQNPVLIFIFPIAYIGLLGFGTTAAVFASINFIVSLLAIRYLTRYLNAFDRWRYAVTGLFVGGLAGQLADIITEAVYNRIVPEMHIGSEGIRFPGLVAGSVLGLAVGPWFLKQLSDTAATQALSE